MRKELLTSSHGIDTYAHMDELTGDLTIENVFDAQPILDANRAASNDGTGGWTPSRQMRRVASVPLVLLHLWDSMGISPTKDRKEFLRRLNDSELSGFRTDGGSRL